MRYYLAYGSNLNLNQMKYRSPFAKVIGKTSLSGYRLVYKGNDNSYGYLTIEKYDGYSVPLGIFKLTLLDILMLDYYEGYPYLYYKEYLPIKINGKIEKALIYIMNDNCNYQEPSIKYINTCIQGYHDFDFDLDILNKAYEDTNNNIKLKIKK